LRKIAERLTSSADRQQALTLDVAIRAHAMRQQQLGRTLKAAFHIDPARLFFLDNFLIDRIKALFGNELEFMRTVLGSYLGEARLRSLATATSGLGNQLLRPEQSRTDPFENRQSPLPGCEQNLRKIDRHVSDDNSNLIGRHRIIGLRHRRRFRRTDSHRNAIQKPDVSKLLPRRQIRSVQK
jgi:hypothetical protein